MAVIRSFRDLKVYQAARDEARKVFEATRAVGAERTVWATDLGQVANPPVEDGLALMADAFVAEGFTEDEIRTMAVANTRTESPIARVIMNSTEAKRRVDRPNRCSRSAYAVTSSPW